MKRINAVMFMLVTLLPVQQTAAESVRRGGGDGAGSAVLQQQLQQISAERDALRSKQEQLAADNERQTKELGDAKEKLTESTREITRLKAQLGESARVTDRAQESGTATAEKLKETQERLQKVVDKYKELVAELRKSEEHTATLEASVGQKGDILNQCMKDNQALYKTAQELIQQYEGKGVWDALMQHEPVTQLKRVEIESIAELYRDQAEQHKFQPQADVSAP